MNPIAQTVTATSSKMSLFKAFQAVALPLNVAVEPEAAKVNPGTYTITVTPGGSYALSDIATSTLRVNGAVPERVIVAANKILLKVPRSTIVDLGNGTGAVAVTGELADGRLVQGEAIVPVK